MWQTYRLNICKIIILSILVLRIDAAEPPPDAQVVAKTATEMWQTKRITELERYLAGLEQRYPKRLSAVVGSAFLDLIYRADFDEAHAKLNRIITAVNANQISVSGDFRLQLATQAHALEFISKRMDEAGISKEQKKREANAVQIRDSFGSRIPDLLILLQLAPNADLP